MSKNEFVFAAIRVLSIQLNFNSTCITDSLERKNLPLFGVFSSFTKETFKARCDINVVHIVL